MLGSLSPSAMILKAAEFTERESLISLVSKVTGPWHFVSIFSTFCLFSHISLSSRPSECCDAILLSVCAVQLQLTARGRGRGGG